MNSGKIIKSENQESYPSRPIEWAEDTLRLAADLVEVALHPPARGQATARTLREIAAILPAHEFGLGMLDLAQGMDTATGKWFPSDDPKVISRRQTCREIEAAIAVPLRGHSGNYGGDDVSSVRYIRVLLVVIERWSRSDDARLAAIAATAAREASELCGLLPYSLQQTMPRDSADLALARSR